MRIVVSRKEMPMNVRERLHPFDWRSKRNRVWRFGVVDIASHKYVLDTVCARKLSKSLYGAQSRLAQRFFLCAKLLEDFSYLPVCGVNEPHWSCPLA
jgi:hypothetical protein